MNLTNQPLVDAITKSLWFQCQELRLAREILYQTIWDELPGWTRWLMMRIS